MSERPIGIFDSGLGGLTVWQVLQQKLPGERFIYCGDTAHLPYGERSPEEILGYVRRIVAWLQGQSVKLIVMACNTSSALVLDTIRQEASVPVLGLIWPAAQAAVAAGSRIGVIATPATAHSGAYSRAIQACGPEVQCWEQGCPVFVPLIETDPMPTELLRQAAQMYLDPLLQKNIDTLVYGCTHYPLLAPILQPLLPPGITLVDPADAITESVIKELGGGDPTENQGGDPLARTTFWVSGDPWAFALRAARWLPGIPKVGQVEF